MTSPKSETSPFERELTLWEASAKDVLKEAKPLSEAIANYTDLPPHIKAEDLDGMTFVIVAIKEFESAFLEQDHAFFVGCLHEDGSKFTTVLGGMVVTETLEALIAGGMTSPVKVTLKLKRQGKYGRYYVLE